MIVHRTPAALGAIFLVVLAAVVPQPALAQGLADQGLANQGLADQGLADQLELVEVASGFDQPVDLRHAGDGSGRLFVVERGGLVRILEDDGTVLPDPFLDLSGAPVNATGGELGLLGLAFHPDYATNGLFYVYYAHSDPVLESVIERYEVSAGDPDVASEASLLRILAFPQEFANHNGGGLHFGPDGYLYLSSGDGGSRGDPFERAQDLGTLLGKIVRIDVDGAAAGETYAIPPDNPFAGVAGAREEIWAYGFRNPWRASFDRLTGDLWIGDVGQGAVEEIDFYPATAAGGRNYGWDCYEGDDPYQPPSDDEPTVCTGPVHFPLLSYAHSADSEVCSVTGGYRYRGSRIAALWGVYLYADFCSDAIWLARRTAEGTWTTEEWTAHPATSIVSFGEDEAGEIYVVTLGGTIYRVESPAAIFFDGFEWGDARRWSVQVP